MKTYRDINLKHGIDEIKSNYSQNLIRLLNECGRNTSISALLGFLGLLSSGFFSAIGFMIIASNRWSILEPSTTVFLILYVQWQTLGLTISKIGIENVVFAAVSKDESIFFSSQRYILQRVFPLAVLFSTVVYFVFSPFAALVTFFTLLVDIHSIIKMADLNARRYYLLTSIANLLNYPLFFLIMFVSLVFFDLKVNGILIIFLVCSLARWLWLIKMDIARNNMKKVFCVVGAAMGTQQVLNYLLFRLDQIVLGTTVFSTFFVSPDPDFIHKFVYMAKFPELISGVIVIAGTVLFPKFFICHPINLNFLCEQFKRHSVMIFCFFISIISFSVMYINIWVGDRINWLFAAPFLVHSVCIFPANVITYSMIRGGFLHGLVRNLAASVIIGSAVVFFLFMTNRTMFLVWVASIQLLLFISFVFVFSWGKKRDLYMSS